MDTRKAMQQALDTMSMVSVALSHGIAETDTSQNFCEVPKSLAKKVDKAIEALREALADEAHWSNRAKELLEIFDGEALAQQGEQPVGEVIREGVIKWAGKYPTVGTKLYAAAPAAQQGADK